MRTDDATPAGILADDLTNAADGAVPFIGRGLQPSISLGGMWTVIATGGDTMELRRAGPPSHQERP